MMVDIPFSTLMKLTALEHDADDYVSVIERLIVSWNFSGDSVIERLLPSYVPFIGD